MHYHNSIFYAARLLIRTALHHAGVSWLLAAIVAYIIVDLMRQSWAQQRRLDRSAGRRIRKTPGMATRRFRWR